jgi:hypothetical protein
MTTRSPVAQVEVEVKAKMRKVEADIEDLNNDYGKATGEEKKIELLKAITAKEGRLHDLYEELKVLRQQQQGNES